MGITTDASGQRSVRVSVEVAGTVEEVWEAVSSGPGISGWYLPTEVVLGFDDEPVRLLSHLGPHTSRVAEVKLWDPPLGFRTVSEDGPDDAPPLITTWYVRPLAGGCLVEVEHSMETELDEWDGLLSSARDGWRAFFRVLKVYLAYFAGKRCQMCTLLITTRESDAKAWETISEPLGLSHAGIGERCRSEADGPELAGVLEWAGDSGHAHQALVRLDQPAPGIAYLQIARMHGWNVPTVRLYFYGEQAATVVSREEPRWQAWLSELFG